MQTYLWEARTKKGELRKGEIEAENEAAVRAQLRRQNLKAGSVKKKPKDLLENISFLQPRIKEKDVVVFARQFSTMIDAGLPLIQCLDILGSQEQNKTFAGVITSVKEDIEGGSTLTDALKKHPKVFDDLFVNLVSAGEAGGILDTVLARLSAYMEKAIALKSKIKGAMTYPASILVVSIGVVVLLLVKVIPVFQELFSSMGHALPAPTQFVVDASGFLRNYILYLIGALIVFVFVFRRYYRTERGRLNIDTMVLKVPVFGPLLRKVAVAKFTRTLSAMLASGVPILEGLDVVIKTAGNRLVENSLMETRRSISEGQTIAQPLKETAVFPPMVVQMIGVGEATGALDTMLEKIADFYDDEVDTAVSAMTALLEPFMMVFLGVVVGGIIIAMYLPIFQMASVVG
jgi:type IV pilus assembly protein PilC